MPTSSMHHENNGPLPTWSPPSVSPHAGVTIGRMVDRMMAGGLGGGDGGDCGDMYVVRGGGGSGGADSGGGVMACMLRSF